MCTSKPAGNCDCAHELECVVVLDAFCPVAPASAAAAGMSSIWQDSQLLEACQAAHSSRQALQ
jgi:hypothetical protein